MSHATLSEGDHDKSHAPSTRCLFNAASAIIRHRAEANMKCTLIIASAFMMWCPCRLTIAQREEPLTQTKLKDFASQKIAAKSTPVVQPSLGIQDKDVTLRLG